MIRAIAIDRSVPIGAFTIRARTLTIDEEGFELAWSISPAPTRPDIVEDPDTGAARFERFVTPLVAWRIRDSSGQSYTGGEGSQDGDLKAWHVRSNFAPAPPGSASALVMTLHELVSREDQAVVFGRELRVIRVSLEGA